MKRRRLLALGLGLGALGMGGVAAWNAGDQSAPITGGQWTLENQRLRFFRTGRMELVDAKGLTHAGRWERMTGYWGQNARRALGNYGKALAPVHHVFTSAEVREDPALFKWIEDNKQMIPVSYYRVTLDNPDVVWREEKHTVHPTSGKKAVCHRMSLISGSWART